MSDKLYHGSCHSVGTLKRHQAWGPPGTPKEESLNVIYFTPNFFFALAIASMPEGVNIINHEERTVCFENPEKFDPKRPAYVYSVDAEKIKGLKQIWIDKQQVAVDIDEIKPDDVEVYKAGDTFKYYSIEKKGTSL